VEPVEENTMDRTLLTTVACVALMLALPHLAGCPGDDDDDDTTPGDDDSAIGDDDSAAGDDDDTTAGDDDTSNMPPDPSPITLQFSGAFGDTLTFESCECEQYPNPTYINFRTVWRSASHNAVLIAEVLGGAFAGPGTYDQSIASARIKLQNEAGSPYVNMYYAADATAGDTLSITVDHIDEDVAWGEYTFSALRDGGQTTSATPMPVPFWCDDVMD